MLTVIFFLGFSFRSDGENSRTVRSVPPFFNSDWETDRDWGGGLWFVTSGSMGRSGGQLQGFCPIGIKGAVEWGGRLAGMGKGLKLFLSLSNPS